MTRQVVLSPPQMPHMSAAGDEGGQRHSGQTLHMQGRSGVSTTTNDGNAARISATFRDNFADLSSMELYARQTTQNCPPGAFHDRSTKKYRNNTLNLVFRLNIAHSVILAADSRGENFSHVRRIDFGDIASSNFSPVFKTITFI